MSLLRRRKMPQDHHDYLQHRRVWLSLSPRERANIISLEQFWSL
jgi:hypothetical protein